MLTPSYKTKKLMKRPADLWEGIMKFFGVPNLLLFGSSTFQVGQARFPGDKNNSHVLYIAIILLKEQLDREVAPQKSR